jgi:hypothetical protein
MATGTTVVPITGTKPRNWKTTSLGICAIVGAVLPVATIFLHGQVPTMDQLTVAGTAIAAGWGLIHAKDASN